MNFRTRYLLAALCAAAAGLLTFLYLGGIGVAAGSGTEIVWVARREILPGTQLKEEMLQRVEVDGPTRQLLAREALPRTASDTPDGWYATRAIRPGEPLIPAGNVSPVPPSADVTPPEALRVVSLRTEWVGPPELQPTEEVDLYVVTGDGEALRILTGARVVQAESDRVSVLVPEEQVPLVIAAADGVTVKVVRRLEGLLR
ncbi:SAF domain-containing protein [Symbiobacterium thermophilum]|uniref:SAF domain-containing protein n=1 Tax=Symbiobacterium thermophilum TaxID=2734 RepID=A0A953IAG7_SYMTR|nr:SAF domain-containing protein [Symbiobacterium thermophilum]MBY6275754.1 hypothetical protein [Symbiobacterium thermophilum]